jgi:hypothetical protein
MPDSAGLELVIDRAKLYDPPSTIEIQIQACRGGTI